MFGDLTTYDIIITYTLTYILNQQLNINDLIIDRNTIRRTSQIYWMLSIQYTNTNTETKLHDCEFGCVMLG
jgi:hypothetical protein